MYIHLCDDNTIQVIKGMIYISDKQQQKIKFKISKLNPFFKKQTFYITLLQCLGCLLIVYGSCSVRLLKSIHYELLLSCFYYFALSVVSPFTGGHLNPIITMVLNIYKKNQFWYVYLIAQILGGILGALIAYLFFDVVPYYYWQEVSIGHLFRDSAGQIFGSFIYVFFLLIVLETNYMAGQYFRYMILAIMFLCGRIYTLRRGSLNPMMAIAVQLFAAISKNNFILFPYCFFLIAGDVIGAILAYYFFKNFYIPLKEGLHAQKDNINRIQSND